MRIRMVASIALTLVVLAGCAPAPTGPSQVGTSGEPSAAARKRITVAINSSPTALSSQLTLQQAGTTEIESLTRGGLSTWDAEGILRPQLGEEVPSIENGLWKLFPDGRMETTWRIKPKVFWHDGVPFTSEDLVFTMMVVRDKDVPFLGKLASVGVESAEAPDSRTLTLRWSQPYIGADSLFAINGGNVLALPLPRHLLEQSYLSDKANFTQLPYWSSEFVGAGPFRVREYERDTRLMLEAFDQYVLGRPKIDEIEVQIIPDINAVIASILAGTVQALLGRGLSHEQGQAVREQWRDGRVDFIVNSVLMIYPQFINTSPAVIGNPQFRRALLYALDREEMASTLLGGMASVAHGRVLPHDPDFAELQPALVKYAYDARRATELIEGLGYAKGSDGRFRDSANQPLSFPVRAGSPDERTIKPMLAAVDYWQQVGLSVDTEVVATQRLRDLEYRATYPGFEMTGQPGALENIASLRSDARSLPENNFQPPSGKNYARYSNPEMDALLGRYFMTVPRHERLTVAQQILRKVTGELIWLTVYYSPDARAISNRLQKVVGANEPGTASWNAHLWDVKS